MNVQDTITQIANSTAKTNAAKSKANMGNSEIDQDSFLRLYMEQLKNQDPSKPADASQLVTQQSQMSTVSELQKLNKNVASSNELMQASSLIGKTVSIANADDPKTPITGVVSEAQITSTGSSIVVNNKSYAIDLIQSIKQ